MGFALGSAPPYTYSLHCYQYGLRPSWRVASRHSYVCLTRVPSYPSEWRTNEREPLQLVRLFRLLDGWSPKQRANKKAKLVVTTRIPKPAVS